MFVHWHLRWNAIPECRKENPAGRYHYLTGLEFRGEVDLPVGEWYMEQVLEEDSG